MAPPDIQFWRSPVLSGENCWKIVRWKWGFAALDSKGNEDWTMTLEAHPKHSSREELYAALNTISGETQIAEPKTEVVQKPDKALLAEIDRLKLEAEEARQALEARKVKEVKEAEIRKKKAEKEQLQIAELKRKRELERKRNFATLENKKKQVAALRKAEEEKKKATLLAAKTIADKKKQGGKPTLDQ